MSDRRGSRRVTASDIALATGVSRATVGFVLNNTPGQTISAGVRERVHAEAVRLGYRPHLHARALRSGETRLVLFLLPEYPVEHNLSRLLDEASLALDDAGYSLVTLDPRTNRKARPLWETLQPDVVICLDDLSAELRSAVEGSGAKVISARDLSTPAEILESDAMRGPTIQVEHLVSRGHRRLAFAGSAVGSLHGMSDGRQAMAVAAAAAREAFVVAAPIDRTSAPAVVESWLADGVTAVVAFNDDIAAIVLGAALRSGVEVPGRLAVIGHDDIPLAGLMVPAISTVRIDTAGIGGRYAAAALSAARGTPMPDPAPAPPRATLVIRDST